MKVASIGEFGLISKISKWIKKKDPLVIRDIGDDCAVIELDRKRYLLFCCDMLIEEVDFTKNTPAYLVGRKAMGSVLSDIASKAGIPKYALISLGLPKDTEISFVRDLYRGFKFWIKKFNFEIVGGDISKAERLTIDISMLGYVEKEVLPLRSNAKIQDIIFITGELGRPRKEFYFTPRIRESRFLTDNFRINSMIDISDGLIQDLNHILQQSNVGAVIYESLIPIIGKKKNIQDILRRGEEFELLFTLSPKEARRLLSKKIKFCYGIGQIVDKKFGLKLIDRNFKERLIDPEGFRHF